MKKIAEEKTKELLDGFDSLSKRVNVLSNELFQSQSKRRSLSKHNNPSMRSSLAFHASMKMNSESFTTKSQDTKDNSEAYTLKQNEIM
jgi:hypothetical protein